MIRTGTFQNCPIRPDFPLRKPRSPRVPDDNRGPIDEPFLPEDPGEVP